MRSKGSCFTLGVWELRLCSLLSFSKVSRQVVMSFCAAGVALPDILTCLQTCRKSFVWQAHCACKVFSRSAAFFVAGAALWRPPSSFRVAGASLQTCRGACSTLHTPPSTLHTPHFTLYTPHFTLHTLHSAISPYTLHSTLYTPHCTLHTPHSTLYTLHSTLTSPESL